jgi:hypothetical protein
VGGEDGFHADPAEAGRIARHGMSDPGDLDSAVELAGPQATVAVVDAPLR